MMIDSHDNDHNLLEEQWTISLEDYENLLRTDHEIIEVMINEGWVTDISQCLEDMDADKAKILLEFAADTIDFTRLGLHINKVCSEYILELAKKVMPERIWNKDEDYHVR